MDNDLACGEKCSSQATFSGTHRAVSLTVLSVAKILLLPLIFLKNLYNLGMKSNNKREPNGFDRYLLYLST